MKGRLHSAETFGDTGDPMGPVTASDSLVDVANAVQGSFAEAPGAFTAEKRWKTAHASRVHFPRNILNLEAVSSFFGRGEGG